jgi:O-antigen/teichoic acid export membrane protein
VATLNGEGGAGVDVEPTSDGVSTAGVARNVLGIVTGQAAARLLGAVKSVVIARWVGAAGLGYFSVVVSIYSVGVALSSFGFRNSITRLVPEYRAGGHPERIRGLIRHVAAYVLITGSIVGGGIFLLSQPLAALFDKPDVAGLLRLAAVGIPFSTLLVMLLAFTRAYHVMGPTIVVSNVVVPVLFIVIFAAACIAGYPAPAAVAALVGADAVGVALCAAYAVRMAPDLTGAKKPSHLNRKELFGYSWVFFFTQIVNIIRLHSDTLILAVFVPASEVGIYSAALKCLVIVHTLLLGLEMVFPPIVAERMACGDTAAVRRLYVTMTRWLIWISLYLVMFLAVFSEEVLAVTFGPAFRAGGAALVIASVGYFANAATGPVAHILAMGDRHKTFAGISFATTVLSVCLSLLAVPRYGILGAAAAKALTLFVFNAILVLVVYREFRIQPYDRGCILQVAIAFAVFGPAWLIHWFSGMLWVPAIASAMAYASLTMRFGVTEEDRELGRGVMKKLRRVLGAG